MPPTRTLLHLTDLHFCSPDQKGHYWNSEATELQLAVHDRQGLLGSLTRDLEQQRIKPDLVVVTGDLLDRGAESGVPMALEFLIGLCEKLNLPRLRLVLVPGNHDVQRAENPADRYLLFDRLWHEFYGTERMGFAPTTPAYLRVSHFDFSAELGIEVVGFNTCEALDHNANQEHGSIGNEQRKKAKEMLKTAQARGTIRIAAMHHHLMIPAGNVRNDYSVMDDAAVLRKWLAQHRFQLVLHGHQHADWHETHLFNEEWFLTIAAAGSAGVASDGRKAWELPLGYQVLKVKSKSTGQRIRRQYNPQMREWVEAGPPGPASQKLSFGAKRVARGTRPTQTSLPKSKPTWISSHPFPTEFFVGREAELEQLEAALLPQEQRPAVICALIGMPGVGKSYLAAHFAQLHLRDFPGGYQRLLLNPLKPLRVDVLLDMLGTQLGLPGGRRGMTKRCRERLLLPRSLLIVENVDSREAAAVVVQLAKELQGCPLLVTGRYQRFSDSAGWKPIPVSQLAPSTAVELLQRELGPEAAKLEPTQANTLAQVLGYLPLALHLAAGYLRSEHYDVESFLAHLKQQKFELEPAYINDPLLAEDRTRAIIARTFELSLGLLRRQLGTSQEAQALLKGFDALGHAPLAGFGSSLGAAIADLKEEEFPMLVAAAASLSLLSRVPPQERKDKAWCLHPLLAELLRTRRGSAEGFERMTRWFVERLPGSPSDKEPAQGAWWEELYRERNALVDWLARVPEADRVRVAKAGSQFASTQGPFPAWMEFCERALKGSLEPSERLRFLGMLVHTAKRSGALEQALWAATEMGTLAQQPDDPSGVGAAGLRAEILQDQGKPDEALRILQKEVLPATERLGKEREYYRAVAQSKIASLLQGRGQLDDALRILQKEVLPAYERMKDGRGYAIALAKIASILQDLRRADEALRILQEKALPEFKSLNDMREHAVALVQLADLLKARERFNEALHILQQACSVFKHLDEKRAHAESLSRIAILLQADGKQDEALRTLQEAHLLYKDLNDEASRGHILWEITNVLRTIDKLDEALRILQKETLPIFEQLKKQDPIGQVRTKALVAQVLQERGELDEALRMSKEEVLPGYMQLQNAEGITSTRARIGQILQEQGDLKEALRIFKEEVLPTFKDNAQWKAISWRRIASILYEQGELKEALRVLHEEVLSVFERPESRVDRAVALRQVALIRQAQDNPVDALRILQEEVLPVFESMGARREQTLTQRYIDQIKGTRATA